MRTYTIIYISVLTLVILVFSNDSHASISAETLADDNWYICANCCKTKKASSAPWESGCKSASSGMHNFQFCGKAGDYNFTCRSCDAEVYLTSITSPSASICCSTGGTHSWSHR